MSMHSYKDSKESAIIDWINDAYLDGFMDGDMTIGDVEWYYGHTIYDFNLNENKFAYTGYWALNVSTTGAKTLIEFDSEEEWREDMRLREEKWEEFLDQED